MPDTPETLRDAGILEAVEHADAVTPRWSERAFDALVDFLRAPRAGFMAEDVRAYAENRGLPVPPDPRAWGGVFQPAARAGLIQKAGYDTSRNAHAHLRPTQVWCVAQREAA